MDSFVEISKNLIRYKSEENNYIECLKVIARKNFYNFAHYIWDFYVIIFCIWQNFKYLQNCSSFILWGKLKQPYMQVEINIHLSVIY